MSLEQKDLSQILETAVVAARLAGRHAMEEMNYVQATRKNESELVTRADTECQQIIIQRILETFPDHGFIAEEGETLLVERLPQVAGDQITFDQVLMVADGDQSTVGMPLVKGALVTATVVEQTKGPKLLIGKQKKRKGFRKKTGHRQELTSMKIKKISI